MEWGLKAQILGFEELRGSHSGANIAAKVIEVLDQYEIRDKVSFYNIFINSYAHSFF